VVQEAAREVRDVREGVRAGVSCTLLGELPGPPHLSVVRTSMRLLRPPCGCFCTASATARTSPELPPSHTHPLSSIVMHLFARASAT
jgi:hypothetical protein